jgi:hypothetical protein
VMKLERNAFSLSWFSSFPGLCTSIASLSAKHMYVYLARQPARAEEDLPDSIDFDSIDFVVSRPSGNQLARPK